jgi:hypothetical protein
MVDLPAMLARRSGSAMGDSRVELSALGAP